MKAPLIFLITLAALISAPGAMITNPIPQVIPKGDITIELQTIADGMAAPLGLAAPAANGSWSMIRRGQFGL